MKTLEKNPSALQVLLDDLQKTDDRDRHQIAAENLNIPSLMHHMQQTITMITLQMYRIHTDCFASLHNFRIIFFFLGCFAEQTTFNLKNWQERYLNPIFSCDVSSSFVLSRTKSQRTYDLFHTILESTSGSESLVPMLPCCLLMLLLHDIT